MVNFRIAEIANSGALALNTAIFAMNPSEGGLQLACMGIQAAVLVTLRVKETQAKRNQTIIETNSLPKSNEAFQK